MGRLFRKKNELVEDYEDDELEDDEIEEDDDAGEDDEDEDEAEEEDEDEDDEIEEDDEDEDDEVDDEEDDEAEEEDDEDDDNEIEEEDDDDEAEDKDDADEEEDRDEKNSAAREDRSVLRHRRRVRNQIICYAVVLLIVGILTAGIVVAGLSISNAVKEKRQAEELAKQQEAAQVEELQKIVIAEPETIEEEVVEEIDVLGELVEAYISEIPMKEKVAGLFIVTPESITGAKTVTQAGESTQEALNNYPVGGFIYFSQNIEDKEQLEAMLTDTVLRSKYPIFLAVDEEGGTVSRVANSGIEVVQVGAMSEIGASGDTSQAFESGVAIGSYLKELGFNVDFAPVADVAGDGSILKDRSFGDNAQTVGDMVANMVEGIEGTGVSACLKHFPGIGDTTEDTHDGRVETDKTLEEMRASDFIAFKAGIDSGVDFVMVSHVAASAVDEDSLPSSLSHKVVTDILRNELGFEGVIVTDALNMGAITEYYTSGEAAVMAVEAGADMLLMPDDFEEAYEAVLAAVQEGRISEERIDESMRRIYRVKCAGKVG